MRLQVVLCSIGILAISSSRPSFAEERPLSGAQLARETARIAAQPGRRDIAGIQIGMPFDRAIEALEARKPGLKVQPVYSTFEAMVEMSGDQKMYFKSDLKNRRFPVSVETQFRTADGADEHWQLFFSLPPNEQVLVGASRVLTWDTGHQPTTASIVTDLTTKYGPKLEIAIPSDHSGRIKYYWLFGHDGSILPQRKMDYLSFLAVCGSGNPSSPTIDWRDRAADLRDSDPLCRPRGATAFAAINGSEVPDLIQRLEVQVLDNDLFGAALRASHALAVETFDAIDREAKATSASVPRQQM